MRKPGKGDYAPYYKHYVDLVESEDFLREMNRSMHLLQAFFASITDVQGDYRYAPEKWSVKEVLSHVIDCERVMSYRALAFSRGDQHSLPSYDENLYVVNSEAGNRTLESLLREHEAVRKSTVEMFTGFSDEMLDRKGTANNTEITPRALAFVIAGHETHHLNVLKERYLGKITNF